MNAMDVPVTAPPDIKNTACHSLESVQYSMNAMDVPVTAPPDIKNTAQRLDLRPRIVERIGKRISLQYRPT